MKPDALDLGAVLSTAEVLRFISEATDEHQKKQGNIPSTGSPAQIELETCADPEWLQGALYQGGQAIMVASDHVLALHRGLTINPILTFAVWSSARNVLEASSKCIWMFDATIESAERITRSLNVRVNEIRKSQTYQRRLLQATEREADTISQLTSERDARVKCLRKQVATISQEISDGDTRVAYLRKRAATIGVTEKLDRNENFIGFGDGTSSISEQIDSAFDDAESVYSLLSAAEHGTTWAVRALGAHVDMGSQPRVSPDLTPEKALWLILMATEWFSRGLWAQYEMFGWDLHELKTVLEKAYDQIRIKPVRRFWRPTS